MSFGIKYSHTESVSVIWFADLESALMLGHQLGGTLWIEWGQFPTRTLCTKTYLSIQMRKIVNHLYKCIICLNSISKKKGETVFSLQLLHIGLRFWTSKHAPHILMRHTCTYTNKYVLLAPWFLFPWKMHFYTKYLPVFESFINLHTYTHCTFCCSSFVYFIHLGSSLWIQLNVLQHLLEPREEKKSLNPRSFMLLPRTHLISLL